MPNFAEGFLNISGNKKSSSYPLPPPLPELSRGRVKVVSEERMGGRGGRNARQDEEEVELEERGEDELLQKKKYCRLRKE